MERREFDVFVSYNRADEVTVHRVAERLRQEQLRDGRTLVSTGVDSAVRKWDLETGRGEQMNMPPSARTSVLLDREGRRLAVPGEDGVVRVFEWPGGRQMHAFRGHQGNVLYAAFSVDGGCWRPTTVTAPSGSGTCRRAEPRSCAATRGQSGTPASAPMGGCSSPEGRTRRSGSGTWRRARGLLTLPGHRGQVFSAHFAPVGLRIASASLDGTLRVWDCPTCGPIDEVMAMARQRAVRDLTDEERAAFVPRPDAGIGVRDAVLLALVAFAGLSLILVRTRWRAAGRRERRPTPPPAVSGERVPAG